MAAAIKALNAKIRSNPVSDYFCSTRTSHPSHQRAHDAPPLEIQLPRA
jgi:hypothetical protein